MPMFIPPPRLSEGQALVRVGVRAAMDVSDGLIDDLTKLAVSSGVGAVVCASQAPVDTYLKRAFPQDHLQLALNGGEDYELLFTGNEEVVTGALSALGPSASIIGRLVAEHPGRVRVLNDDGTDIDIAPARLGPLHLNDSAGFEKPQRKGDCPDWQRTGAVRRSRRCLPSIR